MAVSLGTTDIYQLWTLANPVQQVPHCSKASDCDSLNSIQLLSSPASDNCNRSWKEVASSGTAMLTALDDNCQML